MNIWKSRIFKECTFWRLGLLEEGPGLVLHAPVALGNLFGDLSVHVVECAPDLLAVLLRNRLLQPALKPRIFFFP